MKIDLAEALRQWREGNDNGDGFEIGHDTDTPEEAAERKGLEVIAYGEEGFVVARAPDGHVYAIANSYGPWAVRLDIDEEG